MFRNKTGWSGACVSLGGRLMPPHGAARQLTPFGGRRRRGERRTDSSGGPAVRYLGRSRRRAQRLWPGRWGDERVGRRQGLIGRHLISVHSCSSDMVRTSRRTINGPTALRGQIVAARTASSVGAVGL